MVRSGLKTRGRPSLTPPSSDRCPIGRNSIAGEQGVRGGKARHDGIISKGQHAPTIHARKLVERLTLDRRRRPLCCGACPCSAGRLRQFDVIGHPRPANLRLVWRGNAVFIIHAKLCRRRRSQGQVTLRTGQNSCLAPPIPSLWRRANRPDT